MTRGFPADLPAGRGCPISNLDLYAGVISDPKAHSVGLAAIPHTREATPIHPGLVSLPGSASCLVSPAQPTSPGWVTSLGVLGRRGLSIACENLSLATRLEPGSFTHREVSESDPMVGVVHVRKHGASQCPSCRVNARQSA